jgi:hypothetical protein
MNETQYSPTPIGCLPAAMSNYFTADLTIQLCQPKNFADEAKKCCQCHVKKNSLISVYCCTNTCVAQSIGKPETGSTP